MSSQHFRLFVALDLPGAVRASLAAWAASQAGAISGVRQVAEGSLHVTLCFLGGVEAAAAGPIATACTAVGECSPPALSVGESVWLPPRRPRVLAIALGDETGELGRIQSALAARLSESGFYEAQRRPFLAHVTVARVGRRASGPAAAQPAAPGLPGFTARSVSLYRSHTGPAGARYEVLATVRLSGDRGRRSA